MLPNGREFRWGASAVGAEGSLEQSGRERRKSTTKETLIMPMISNSKATGPTETKVYYFSISVILIGELIVEFSV